MRTSSTQPDPIFVQLVERYSAFISSPTEKLKFLRSSLDKYHLSPLADRVGWLKQITFRKIILETLLPFLPPELPKPKGLALIYRLYQVRYPIFFLTIAGAGVLTLITGQWLYSISNTTGLWDLRLQSGETPVVVKVVPSPVPVRIKDNGLANTDKIEGFAAEQIWMVERTEQYEEYSNGGRILTQYETNTEPRNFYALCRQSSPQSVALPFEPVRAVFYPELREKPAGILYHVTQSDNLPFLPNYNKNLKGKIDHLAAYIAQEKLYNYLIDRFGRIYRIVKDEDYANHSGNSIWGDSKALYVNLNHSFIGVAFEGNWSADVKLNPDDINEAQIRSGKILTEILRSKYKISEDNCVTHGMVSVNPTSYIIGYHLDWAVGFPFAAIGLKDNYQVALPSMMEFGFKHDRAFQIAIGGQLWPGIEAADTQLQARANELGISVEVLSQQLQKDYTAYRQWLVQMREQSKLPEPTAKGVEDLPVKGSK